MRLFARNPYRLLEQQLGYRFRDKALLATALRHRSFRYEREDIDSDNQRLEFLGDAALGLVTGEYLYTRFPDIDEGPLTCLRSRLASGKALARLASAIELGRFIQLGKGEQQSGGRQRESVLTDALEAILGAAYLDGRLKAVEKIFRTLFVPSIEIRTDDLWTDNPKGRLQVVAQQRWKANPSYRQARVDGPAHERVFTVEVSARGHRLATGRGSTKRDAEQDAARAALTALPPSLPASTARSTRRGASAGSPGSPTPRGCT